MYCSTITPALNGPVMIWPTTAPTDSITRARISVANAAEAPSTSCPPMVNGIATAAATSCATSTASSRMPRTRQKSPLIRLNERLTAEMMSRRSSTIADGVNASMTAR